MAPQEGPEVAADGTVIVVGAGLSGLATALGAALHGRSVTVFEAAELVGGAAAYSGGQVWVGASHVEAREGIDDDLERTERYVRAIAHDHPEALDERAMRRWLTTAPAAVRYWEDIGAIRWTVIPEPRGLPRGGRRGARGGPLPDQRGDRRQRARRVARSPAGQPLLPRRDHVRRHVHQGSPADAVDEPGGVAEHAGVPAFGLPQQGTAPPGAEGRDPLTFGTGVVASFLARVLGEDRDRDPAGPTR